MIIDNVKVYTPDQKFVNGGLVLDHDRIEAVYTNENKPELTGKEVLDSEGVYAIPGLIDLISTDARGMISVMIPLKQSNGSQNTKLLWE